MREETSRILRLPFSAEDIDQLPRTYHKGKADERTIQLDYVGHAAATARLLDADFNWTWEPFACDEQGLPRIIRRGDALELWGRLTIDGTTKPGVGTVPVEYDRDTGQEIPADQDTAKELVSDFVRNAAMRFGVALDLWRKHDTAPAVPTGPPCPHCGAPVLFNDEKTRGRKPAWSCSNRGCGGGGLRNKDDESKGHWPWGTYDADFFTSGDSEVELKVEGPSRPAPPVTGGFDPADLRATRQLVEAELGKLADLTALGITEDQARAELQVYKEHPGFAAGTIPQIRSRVDHAITLCVALGLDGEGLLGDLWAEWQKDDPSRATLAWSTAKAREVLDFARTVQDYLRARI